MALDETAKKENIKASIRKYFVENVARTGGKRLTFDKSLSNPRIQGQSPVDEWVSVNHGSMDVESLSSHDIIVHCCTRKDAEGIKLAKLRDVVMGYLSDITTTDGFCRIPFYQIKMTGPWTLLGAFLVTEVHESDDMESTDETKFITLTCRLRFASKV